MHKYNSLFFSVLIFLVACKGNDVPKGIIEQQKMADLLTEVHIVDGGMYNVIQVPDSLYKYGIKKYLAVFKKFGTDSVQFKKSFNFYTLHPAMLDAIYKQIAINIKQKTDSLNKVNQVETAKENKRLADSLKKAPKTAPPPVNPKPASPVPPKNVKPHGKKKVNPHDI